MICNKFVVIPMLLIFLISADICKSQDITESNDILKFHIMSEKKNILSVTYWYTVNETFLCMALSSVRESSSSVPDRKLVFFRKRDKSLTKEYEFETADSFVSMYPVSAYDDSLITVWLTGSAYHVCVFSFVGNKIRLTLDTGTRLAPEVYDYDNDGVMEILISEGSFLTDTENNILTYPYARKVYKWNGISWQILKIIPWNNRITN